MKKTFTYLLGGALFALFLLMPSSAKAKVTINWDWENNIPSTIRDKTVEGNDKSGSIASDTEGITLDYYAKVAGAYVKLQPVDGQVYAQFNANTAFRIPVVSTSDKITIKTYAGQHNYTFDGDAATEDEHTYSITASQVAAGYVEIVSTAYMNLYSVKAVLAYKPTELIAKWTFDTGYDQSGSIYTPNAEDFSGIPQTTTSVQVPQIYANTYFGTQSNYIASVGKSTTANVYWSVKSIDSGGKNYGKVFSLYPYGTSNSFSDESDYINENKQLIFYQFSFPTNGLEDINISYDITYGSNAAKNIRVVYSTDGGTTWVRGTDGVTGSHWASYQTNTSSITAANTNNVIVRLLTDNGDDGDYRLNLFSVKGKRMTTSVTISDAKYATYYNSIPVELPENLQAATIDAETSGTLTLNYRYGEGDVIPGGTPVLLKATAADTYTLIYAANNTESAPDGNLLYGSDVETTTTGGGTGAKYYALQKGDNGLGFYWKAADGAAFTSGAHKAWLALPKATTANFFSLDDETTGVKAIENSQLTVGTYYDLQGRKVAQPTKGLYIVNGKKVIIK